MLKTRKKLAEVVDERSDDVAVVIAQDDAASRLGLQFDGEDIADGDVIDRWPLRRMNGRSKSKPFAVDDVTAPALAPAAAATTSAAAAHPPSPLIIDSQDSNRASAAFRQHNIC